MFITLEGPEGSGKSSQLPPLEEYLSNAGYDVLTTREPGGTPIGDQVRTVLLDKENTAMQPRTEILLFQASRAQLVDQVIRPHLEKGGVVLCDRYADSTVAYQGYGYRRSINEISAIINFATGGLKPDLTILLDVDVEIGLTRRQEGGDVNRLDIFELTFHQNVRDGYHRLAKAEPHRWVTIDAGQSPKQVQKELRKVILERLQLDN
ncbi:MAG: dTMP kinase [Anaerolineales bacterium]|nr:dTMP kinase [Chloroflexota bacterium]MBL6981223.1 dTMP kinase [Anaerolineales bacterium]